MRRLLIALSLALLIPSTAFLQSLDTTGWYVFNGDSLTHTFSVNFPTDWKARTFDDDLQGLTHQSAPDDLLFGIQEFEGQSYEQAINYYVDTNHELLSSKDIVLTTNADYLAKEVSYSLPDGSNSKVTFVKRGSLVVALSNPESPVYQSQLQAIYDSFKFTDSWKQFITSTDRYTFIYPERFDLKVDEDHLTILDPNDHSQVIFEVHKFANTGVQAAAENAESENEILQSVTDYEYRNFPDTKLATYFHSKAAKNLARIVIPHGNATFVISAPNPSSQFPRSSYNEQFITEILESFDFFELSEPYFSYQYFYDVRENHTNASAINELRTDEIIAGYPDGSFRPNGEINRAELTKLVVAAKINPDPNTYNNCFTDVTDQWFAPYVCYAKAQDWVAGYDDGTFRPETQVNRAESLRIIIEGVVTTDLTSSTRTTLDIAEDAWYIDYFSFAENNKLLDKQHIQTVGDNYYYSPGGNITRKEVAETISRIRTKSL